MIRRTVARSASTGPALLLKKSRRTTHLPHKVTSCQARICLDKVDTGAKYACSALAIAQSRPLDQSQTLSTRSLTHIQSAEPRCWNLFLLSIHMMTMSQDYVMKVMYAKMAM